MKIDSKLNFAEIAEIYYKKVGKFTNRENARKSFMRLKNPDPKAIAEIQQEIRDIEIKY